MLVLPSLKLAHAHIFGDVLDLYERQRGLSFADCFHLLVAQDLGCREIVSFDRKLRGVTGINRVEPPRITR